MNVQRTQARTPSPRLAGDGAKELPCLRRPPSALTPRLQPSASCSFTLRLHMPQQGSAFARVARAIADAEAMLGAIDLVRVEHDQVVGDVTVACVDSVRTINEEIKLAAAHAIASVIPEDEPHADYIIPSVFNRQVAESVS
jgi:hypothetical protein